PHLYAHVVGDGGRGFDGHRSVLLGVWRAGRRAFQRVGRRVAPRAIVNQTVQPNSPGRSPPVTTSALVGQRIGRGYGHPNSGPTSNAHRASNPSFVCVVLGSARRRPAVGRHPRVRPRRGNRTSRSGRDDHGRRIPSSRHHR